MPKQKTNKTILKRVKLTGTGKMTRRHQLAVGHLKRKKGKSALERARRPVAVYKSDSRKYKRLIGA